MIRRCFLFFWAACSGIALAADPQFVEVAAARNLNFITSYGTDFETIPGSEMMQRNMGNGMAVGDYDNDGDLDIYLLGQMGFTNKLFRNDLDLGAPNFTEVSTAAGVDMDGMSRTAAFVDLDNDGWKDLVVVNDDDGGDVYPYSAIFRNNADGTFTNVTDSANFRAVGLIRGGLAVADYDGDGLLDLYVTNWGQETGGGDPALPGHNVLFRNLGGFVFQDTTNSSELKILARDSFQPLLHDFDEDFDADLYVAVDHTSDEYYRNRGDGTFIVATGTVGTTHTGNDMGAVCGDIDDDLDLDIYVTNITDPSFIFGTTQGNVLYVNEWDTLGYLHFTDEAMARGVDDTYWGWGVQMTDVENDGDLDIVAATGFDQFVFLVGVPGSILLNSPMVLFLNDGSGNFSRDTGAGLGGGDDSRGLAAVDYDRDGDEDLVMTNIQEPVRLFENVSTSPGNSLGIRLVQAPGGNRDGIGATVFYTAGGVTRRREMVVTDSYLTGTPPEIHIGLGSATQVDQMTVRWTDGTQSLFSNIAANQDIVLSQADPDVDADGIVDTSDCDAADGATWSVPGAVSDLRLSKAPGMTRLDWSRPGQPGGLHLTFDLLRGTDPALGDAGCLLDGLTQRTADDADPVVAMNYYMVRAVNACGGGLATDSSGGPRPAPSCP